MASYSPSRQAALSHSSTSQLATHAGMPAAPSAETLVFSGTALSPITSRYRVGEPPGGPRELGEIESKDGDAAVRDATTENAALTAANGELRGPALPHVVRSGVTGEGRAPAPESLGLSGSIVARPADAVSAAPSTQTPPDPDREARTSVLSPASAAAASLSPASVVSHTPDDLVTEQLLMEALLRSQREAASYREAAKKYEAEIARDKAKHLREKSRLLAEAESYVMRAASLQAKWRKSARAIADLTGAPEAASSKALVRANAGQNGEAADGNAEVDDKSLLDGRGPPSEGTVRWRGSTLQSKRDPGSRHSALTDAIEAGITALQQPHVRELREQVVKLRAAEADARDALEESQREANRARAAKAAAQEQAKSLRADSASVTLLLRQEKDEAKRLAAFVDEFANRAEAALEKSGLFVADSSEERLHRRARIAAAAAPPLPVGASRALARLDTLADACRALTLGPPSAPTHVTALAGDRAATVSWKPPFSSAPVVACYEVTPVKPLSTQRSASASETPSSPGAAASGCDPKSIGVTPSPVRSARRDPGAVLTSPPMKPGTDDVMPGAALPDDAPAGGGGGGSSVAAQDNGGGASPSGAERSRDPGSPSARSMASTPARSTGSVEADNSAAGIIPVGPTVVVAADQTTCVIRGLRDGVEVAFAVVAVSAQGLRSEPGSAVPVDGDDDSVALEQHEAESPGPSPASARLLVLPSVVPRCVPEPPRQVTATAAFAAIHVVWEPPEFDGGSAILQYDVRVEPLTGSTTDTGKLARLRLTPSGDPPAPVVVTVDAPRTAAKVRGLANGVLYSVAVRAINAAGTSAAAVSGAPVTPAIPPLMPGNVVAAPGDLCATVTWNAPVDDGGAPVQSYTVFASKDGGAPEVASTTNATTTTISGLEKSSVYVFSVVATNAAGTSERSEPSRALVACSVPTSPKEVVAALTTVRSPDEAGDAGRSGTTAVAVASGSSGEGGPGVVSVSWQAPDDDGGAPVSAYTVIMDPGGIVAAVSGGGRSCTVGGLQTGVDYRFAVVARNRAGQSSPAPSSEAIHVTVPPGPPLDVHCRGRLGGAYVWWQAPGSDGGSSIESFTVYSVKPGRAPERLASVGETECVVEDFDDGETCLFAVTASNLAGEGQMSEPTEPAVAGASTPLPPAEVRLFSGDGEIIVEWDEAPDDGGVPVTSYTICVFPGGYTHSVTAGDAAGDDSDGEPPRVATVVGLMNGVEHRVRVTAINSVGESDPQSAASHVVPAGIPEPPAQVRVTPGPGFAVLKWSAPLDDGGAPVRTYHVTCREAGVDSVVNAPQTAMTARNLPVGVPLTFSVAAETTAGRSQPRKSEPPISLPSG